MKSLYPKFDETVEAVFRLGVDLVNRPDDPGHGVTAQGHGQGRAAVFAEGDAAREAEEVAPTSSVPTTSSSRSRRASTRRGDHYARHDVESQKQAHARPRNLMPNPRPAPSATRSARPSASSRPAGRVPRSLRNVHVPIKASFDAEVYHQLPGRPRRSARAKPASSKAGTCGVVVVEHWAPRPRRPDGPPRRACEVFRGSGSR